MGKSLMLGLLLGGMFGSSGCVYVTATPSVQGRAWVVRNEVAGSSFWNCDATSGEPTCYQTTKAPAPAAAAK